MSVYPHNMKKKINNISYNNKVSELTLGNFKGYQKKTKLSFSPGVNLIYGKNSAGKSSIIQSIRLLKQSLYVSGSSCNFHLIVPSYMRIPGSLTFPEGFQGVINKKDLSKDLTIGIGTFGRPFNDAKNRHYRDEKYLEHVFNNKNNNQFPDIKEINFKTEELYESNNQKKNEATDINLVFKKKKKFKDNKLGNLLTNVWKGSRRRKEGFNVIGYLKAFKDKSYDLISENDLYFQDLDIEKSNFRFGVYSKFHQIIMKDIKKYRESININIEFGLSNIRGIGDENLKKLLSGFKEKNKKKKKLLQDTNINAGEFYYLGKERLKKLKKFINSEDILNKEKFENYLYKDFKEKLKLIKHRDVLYDIGQLEANYIGGKQATDIGFLPPPNYFIYIHDLVAASLDVSYLNDLNVTNTYESCLQDLQFTVRQVSVVPGLRQLPNRYLKRGLEENFVGEGAENLGDILSNQNTKKIVNEWFTKFEIPYFIDTKLVGNFYELIMKPKENKSYNLSYRDVGLGYSLSLPLIITALTSKSSTILCEEPELHLHPKMQASLMELFMYSSLVNNNQFIIETHSENLLLRAQKIIRKGMIINNQNTDIKNEYVSVFNVFASDTEGSDIQKIILDKNGEFKTHWKDGFFSERLDELF